MTSSVVEVRAAHARDVRVTGDALTVDLVDGRTVKVPLAWYPCLAHGSPSERTRWRLIGRGEGIHWPDLDEDISIESLLVGRRSGESSASLQRWLKSRRLLAGKRMPPTREKRHGRGGRRGARG